MLVCIRALLTRQRAQRLRAQTICLALCSTWGWEDSCVLE